MMNWAENKLNSFLNEPQWLIEARKNSLADFNVLGVPGRKQELWKYSNVKRLELDTEATTVAELAKSDSVRLLIDSSGYQIQGQLPEGIEIENFKDLNENPMLEGPMNADRSFSALNQAVMTQGLKITLNPSSSARLELVYQGGQVDWNVLRLCVVLKDNSELDLKEVYTAGVKLNQVTQYQLKSNSRLKIQSQRCLDDSSLVLSHCSFICEDSADVQQMIQNHQAHFLHEIVDVVFNKQHSTFRSSVANVSVNSSQICENFHVYHHQKNCKSRVIQRSLADDKSQVTVNAKAIVDVAADGSDISQSLKNVLLSDDARINSKPELEINTDEVVAAHGSTIGELDESAMNYLRSRGIGKKQAKKMLVESFLQEANLFQLEDFLETLNYE